MRALEQAVGNFRTTSRNKRVVVSLAKECKKATLPVAGVTAFIFGASTFFSLQSVQRCGHETHKQTGSAECVSSCRQKETISMRLVRCTGMAYFRCLLLADAK